MNEHAGPTQTAVPCQQQCGGIEASCKHNGPTPSSLITRTDPFLTLRHGRATLSLALVENRSMLLGSLHLRIVGGPVAVSATVMGAASVAAALASTAKRGLCTTGPAWCAICFRRARPAALMHAWRHAPHECRYSLLSPN